MKQRIPVVAVTTATAAVAMGLVLFRAVSKVQLPKFKISSETDMGSALQRG